MIPEVYSDSDCDEETSNLRIVDYFKVKEVPSMIYLVKKTKNYVLLPGRAECLERAAIEVDEGAFTLNRMLSLRAPQAKNVRGTSPPIPMG